MILHETMCLAQDAIQQTGTNWCIITVVVVVVALPAAVAVKFP